jgi:hypothetical protein
MLVSCLAYSSILKMEAICSSETSGCLRTTWGYNPEDCSLRYKSMRTKRIDLTKGMVHDNYVVFMTILQALKNKPTTVLKCPTNYFWNIKEKSGIWAMLLT